MNNIRNYRAVIHEADCHDKNKMFLYKAIKSNLPLYILCGVKMCSIGLKKKKNPEKYTMNRLFIERGCNNSSTDEGGIKCRVLN